MFKYLAVFDFDHTILDDNSDTAVVALLDKNTLPHKVKLLQQEDGWTSFMQAIFNLLHERGVPIDIIENTVSCLPAVKGMPDLITELKLLGYDIIIISDSNSYFIKSWLEKNGLSKYIDTVFTNPAEVVDGLLKISMYHVQTTCKLSSQNMCKGQILDEFIEAQNKAGVVYERVIYVGDGVNDFCPVLRLKENDIACVRHNYKLMDLVNKARKGKSFEPSGKPHDVKPEILAWDTGLDILGWLKG